MSRTSSGRRLVQDGGDHAVEAHALARAGGAGDEQVGHGGEVGDEGVAADGLARASVRRDGDFWKALPSTISRKEMVSRTSLGISMRRCPAAHAVDADRLGLEAQGQVVGQSDDP